MYGKGNVIDIADYNRSYAVPISDASSTQNAYYVNLIKQWRKAFSGPVAMYTYYVKYCWHSLPTNLLNLIATDMPFFKSLGTDGLGTYCEPANWLTYEAVHAEIAALSWNNALDSAAWRTSYLQDRYGTAAGPMHTYFSSVESAGRALLSSPCGDYGSAAAVGQALSDFQEAKTALNQARASATDPAAAFLVQRLLWDIAFAIADTQISLYGDEHNAAAATQAQTETAGLVTAHRFDGIILENSYAAGRYGGSADRATIAAMYRAPAFGFLPASQVTLSDTTTIAVAAQSVDYQAHAVVWSALVTAGIALSSSSGSLAVNGPGTASQTVTLTRLAGAVAGTYPLVFTFTVAGETLPQATLRAAIPAGPGTAEPLAAYFNNVGGRHCTLKHRRLSTSCDKKYLRYEGQHWQSR